MAKTPAPITSSDPTAVPPRWRYGDAWERYPIRSGETWRVGTGIVAAHDLFHPLPSFLKTADCLFIDPPWNLGNLNTFYTKAGRSDHQTDFQRFASRLFTCIHEIAPRSCYIEIGNQQVTDFRMRLHDAGYPYVYGWQVTYYRKHPCWLLKGSKELHSGPGFPDFNGIDEERCIEMITRDEPYTVIGDLCMGRGLVGYHAFRAGRAFVGGEMNPRRLAVLLDRVARDSGVVERIAEKRGSAHAHV